MCGSSSPSATQTQVSELPSWAKPTAQRNLAKAEALTSDKPFQSYTDYAKQEGMDPSRVAGFSGLQNASFQGAQNLQPSAGLRPAMGMAGAGAFGSLNAGNDYMSMATDPSSMRGFMSPYMQNVVDTQQQEAIRQSGIQGVQGRAQATQANAFGGSRQGLMEAERQRNLGTQLGDIQARGLQSAFDKGQQAQQFGSQLGLQGYGQAIQGAGQMANIGTQQLGQQKDILSLQNQFGAQQQANKQAELGYNMQDYSAAQQYPYQQLSFLSNILRGTPMGGVSTMYGSQSTPAQMIGALGGLGVGAAGMMNAFNKKDGGMVDSYADGGSVESPQALESIVGKLSDGQLQQAAEAAQARGDVAQLQAIQAEMAMRASERQGMAGAFNQLPEEQQESMMAGGGIVAFADEGLVQDKEEATSTAGQFATSIMDALKGGFQKTAEVGRIRREKDEALPGIFEALTPTERKAREAKVKELTDQERAFINPKAEAERTAKREKLIAEKAKADSEAKLQADAGVELDRLQAKLSAAPAAPAARGTSISSALNKAAPPAKEAEDSFEANFKKRELALAEMNKPQQKLVDEAGEESKKRVTALEARAFNDAMTKFGFGLASAAGKPGTNLVRMLGEAGALIPEALEKNQQLVMAARDRMDNMRMEQAKFGLSLKKNDMAAALSHAQAISAEKKGLMQLDLQRQQIAATLSSATKGTPIQQIADDMQRANPKLDRIAALQEASKIAGYSFKGDAANQTKLATALEARIKTDKPIMLMQAQMLGKPPEEQAVLQKQIDDRSRQLRASLLQTNPEFASASQVEGSSGVSIPQGVTIQKVGG